MHRLAHANCLHPSALFGSNNTRRYHQKFENLIGNKNYNLISQSKFEDGMYLPDQVKDFYEHDYVTIGYFYNHGYCPYCLRDSDIIYSRLKWSYRWNTHCEIHHVKLSNRCVHCDAVAFMYSEHDYDAWRKPWGQCPNCNKRLAADQDQFPEHPHFITKKIHSEALTKINQLVERVQKGNEPPYKLSLLIFLADLLQSDLKHRSEHSYKILMDNGMDPMTYVCCEWPELYAGKALIKWVPPDSAMMMAWHILKKRMDIFFALMDHGWIPNLFPDPLTGNWTPSHIAQKTFPEDLFNAYLAVQDFSWNFSKIFGTEARSRHLFCVHTMYTSSQESMQLVLKMVDKMLNGYRIDFKAIRALRRYFRTNCNKIQYSTMLHSAE